MGMRTCHSTDAAMVAGPTLEQMVVQNSAGQHCEQGGLSRGVSWKEPVCLTKRDCQVASGIGKSW